jgi:hypothetical protein
VETLNGYLFVKLHIFSEIGMAVDYSSKQLFILQKSYCNMIASIAHKTPAIILEKLARLLNALQEVKNHYEQVAKRIQNKQLKISILGLAQESKQYANELIAHIETLGGSLNERTKSECNRVDEAVDLQEIPCMTDELIGLKLGEQQVMKTYRDVLNDISKMDYYIVFPRSGCYMRRF